MSGVSSGAVRIDAHGHRDVVDFGVGEEPVALHLPGVEHLAAQRQDGLAFLVAAHLGAAAGGVALDQEDLVVADVLALAVGQLAGQHGHAGALALLDLLAGALAGLRGLDGQFGQLLAVVDVLVEPELQRRAHEARHQPHGVARVQAFLDLALELRVEHLGAEHVRGAREHVFGQQLHALGQQRMQFDEALHRGEEAVAQAAFVRAACAGGNQVDVALAHRLAVFGEGHAPVGALAFGEVVGVLVGVAAAFEERNDRVAVERLHQVVAQAALVEPLLAVLGLLVHQRDAHAGASARPCCAAGG
jgi:hypothetical protein